MMSSWPVRKIVERTSNKFQTRLGSNGPGVTIQFITNTVHPDKILYICGDEIEGFLEFEELVENWYSFHLNFFYMFY